MPKKNILVFSDGTGQQGGKNPDTNVYKLFRMVENRTEKQIAFYDKGLGSNWAGNLAGNAAGWGISKNILECYHFIFKNYNAGDQVFLFGFSRGATTVRSLAGFIHMFGMLPKSRPELIKKAYRIYRISDEKRRKDEAWEFVKRYHNMWCRVKFIGVWDTVEALGLPFKNLNSLLNKIPLFRHQFHSLNLSESVVHARQALAIDDERETFHPTIWEQKLSKSDQTLKQVWFLGSHTDVGGGYDEQSLSDISLIWMTQESVDKGLLIYHGNHVKLAPDPDGLLHDSRGTRLTKLYKKMLRFWDEEKHGKPVIHESVLMRSKSRYNKKDVPYNSWILKQKFEVEAWPDYLKKIDCMK
jgi:uncharacterized protein (DUF2235 family)